MKLQEAPYIYKWDIWINNLCHGYMFVERFDTLQEARANINRIQNKYEPKSPANGCLNEIKYCCCHHFHFLN